MKHLSILAVAFVAFGCSRKSDEKHACTKSVDGGFCVQLPPDANERPEVKKLDDETTVYDYRRVTVYASKLKNPDDWTLQVASMKGTIPTHGADVKTSDLPEGTLVQYTEINTPKRVYTHVVLHRGSQALWCQAFGEEPERAEACKTIKFL